MIHTLTLNPAIDRILYLNSFEKNITNRVKKTIDTIGGKGTHVSINLKLLGQPSNAFGICHGDNGLRVMKMLKKQGINVLFNHYCEGDKETRTNYLLIEDNTDCTIIAETGVRLKEQELRDLLAAMEASIQPGDYLVFSGDASNSPDPSVYNHILQILKGRGLKVFLDTSGSSLKECIQESPFMIKPNLNELSSLLGYTVPEEDRAIVEAIQSLDKYGVAITAVSLGGKGSIVRSPEGIFRVHTPSINVCNTIGCGDCYLAGFIHGLSRGYSIADTIRTATAISAATAESKLSAGYDSARATALNDQVIIEKIKEIY